MPTDSPAATGRLGRMMGEPQRTKLDAKGRLAAIDIGSNSVRLVVIDPLHRDQFRIVDEERQSTRLARSLGSTGELDAAAIEETLLALRHFKQLAEGLQVTHIETIATCAVREASNSGEFLRRVDEEVGLNVRVISAAREALYALRSVQAAFDISDKNIAVVDVGGGSTEIVLVSSGFVEKTYSTNLGTVRMTELFGGQNQLFDAEHEQLLEAIDRETHHQITRRPFVPQVIYGTGGTFTAIASMLLARGKEDDSAIWGYRVSRADVRHLLDRLRRLSTKDRRNVPGLGADRADIIVAGLAIVDRVMARLKTNVLRVHTGGVRDGLLLSLLDQSDEFPEDRERQVSAVERFAVRCGVDVVHSRHVAWLAGMIFDQMSEPFGLTASDRNLLITAAILRDVGYLINYKSHHKHSHQLILNSRLPGFRKHELALVATIARYHRGANPKKKHSHFRHLADSDQERVRKLAAILRIAGGLDRGYTQRVQDIRVMIAPERITLHVEASSNPELEIWSVRGHAELFEKVFGAKLVVTADGPWSTVSGKDLRSAPSPGNIERR